MSNLDLALRYAAKDKPVFPCNPETTGEWAKSPRCRRGFRDASTDPEQIRRWWDEQPDSAVGMPTGAASGVIVLDVDTKGGKHGDETLRKLEQAYGDLPLSYTNFRD